MKTFLERTLRHSRQRIFGADVVVYHPSVSADRKKLQRLLGSRRLEIIDQYQEQCHELFLSRHPQLRMAKPHEADAAWRRWQNQKLKHVPLWEQGSWVYYSWTQSLVHILNKQEFAELRSSRNRNLIAADEQKRFQRAVVGIAGLSVGNSVAATLTLESGPETLRLADFDGLGLSNLNRIRSGLHALGLNKAVLSARQIYELNPYAKLTLVPGGLNRDTARKFVQGLDVLVDEMDDVAMKLQLRHIARKFKIPVVSAADNGDNIIIDVERFDQEPRRPVYHGTLSVDDPDKALSLNPGQRIQLINEMVGVNLVSDRMKDSLLEIGRSLYTWPQLGGAAMLAGATVAYLVRRIVLGQPIASGKYEVNLDAIFIPGYTNWRAQEARKAKTKQFLAAQDRLFKK